MSQDDRRHNPITPAERAAIRRSWGKDPFSMRGPRADGTPRVGNPPDSDRRLMQTQLGSFTPNRFERTLEKEVEIRDDGVGDVVLWTLSHLLAPIGVSMTNRADPILAIAQGEAQDVKIINKNTVVRKKRPRNKVEGEPEEEETVRKTTLTLSIDADSFMKLSLAWGYDCGSKLEQLNDGASYKRKWTEMQKAAAATKAGPGGDRSL